MPPHNGEGVARKPASRSHPAPTRIVPAIPLSLSRGKPNRTKQNVVAASTAALEQKVPAGAGQDNAQTHDQEDVAKAAAPAQEEGPGHEAQSNGGDRVIAPSVGTPVSHSSVAMSASDDHAAAPSSESAPSSEAWTNGQAETHSPAVVSSPSTVRKPSDRFEMRQIRTELPPAFIPAEQFAPRSATSSQTRPHPHALPHGHPTNPSVGSIVFGGRDSCGSSPAPPLSAGSAYLPPRNVPMYGHMHNGSETQGLQMVQGNEQFTQRQPGFVPSVPQQPYQPQIEHPHAHFRYPSREVLAAGIVSPPNGYAAGSRSGSPFSPLGPESQRHGSDLPFVPGHEHLSNGGKHIPQGPRASFTRNARPIPPQVQYHVPPPPPLFPYPELATSFENAESLRGYAFNHFNNPDFADCVLELADEYGGRLPLEGHRIILSRSPVLAAIIRSNDGPNATVPKPLVKVFLSGKQLRIQPVVLAIRYLYGGPLPPFDMYDSAAPLGSFSVSVRERMDTALQHIATGSWMGIAAIAHRGVDMAASLLNWDTISSALEFALDGGISQMWPIDDGEEQHSTCSSDDSVTKPEAGGTPKYGHYASGLLQRVIEFTVQNIPSNFYIDSAAPASSAVPRLPVPPPKHESKSSKSDPRLSKIKFGDMSAEAEIHQRPSPTATAISSLLLSLPFPLLRYLLEHFLLTERLGAETVASIMRQIVGEREARRLKASKALAASQHAGGLDTYLVQNLYWQETVEFSDQSRSGFRLARKRVGMDTPPSSGTESERHSG